jgi:hypothetical protein
MIGPQAAAFTEKCRRADGVMRQSFAPSPRADIIGPLARQARAILATTSDNGVRCRLEFPIAAARVRRLTERCDRVEALKAVVSKV